MRDQISRRVETARINAGAFKQLRVFVDLVISGVPVICIEEWERSPHGGNWIQSQFRGVYLTASEAASLYACLPGAVDLARSEDPGAAK